MESSSSVDRSRTACAAVVVGFSLAVLPARADDLLFERHVISAESQYSAVAVLDVNRDGRDDIVCGGFWYEAPRWRRHFVRDVERIQGRFDGYSHLPLDVNHDGWTDIVTVNYRSRSLRWIEHPGPALGEWPMHTVEVPGPMETGRLYDIDADGRLDVLPNGQGFAAWWELLPAPAGIASRWMRHELPAEVSGHGIGFGDIDGDGRGDIVGPSGWLKAPEDRRAGRWVWHREFDLGRASVPVLVVDVDDDGDNDLVWTRAHGFGVFWLEQDRDGGARRWRHHTIDASWSQCHAPLWEDLDGDGRPELIGGKRYLAHEGRDPGAYDPLVSYRYQFDNRSRTWDRWPVSINERVGFGLDPKTADLDADGDRDLVVCGRSGLYWLENLGPATPGDRKSSRPVYPDHSNLSVVAGAGGDPRPIASPFDWGARRAHIVAAIEHALGPMPATRDRVPLRAEVLRTETSGDVTCRHIAYDVAPGRRVTNRIWRPASPDVLPAVLCVMPPGDQDAAAESLSPVVARELAGRGLVCIVAASSREDPPALAIWSCMRTVDLVESLPDMDAERVGCLGIGRAAPVALLLAALEQRIVATVASGELSAENPPWPADQVSFAEVLGAISPRAVSLRPPGGSAGDPTGLLARSVAAASIPFRMDSRARVPAIDGAALDAADVSGCADAGTWLAEALRGRQ